MLFIAKFCTGLASLRASSSTKSSSELLVKTEPRPTPKWEVIFCINSMVLVAKITLFFISFLLGVCVCRNTVFLCSLLALPSK